MARVYDEAGNVIEDARARGRFQRVRCRSLQQTDNFRRASERRPVRPTKTHASPPATDTPAVIAIAATKLPVRSTANPVRAGAITPAKFAKPFCRPVQAGPSAGCFWTSECLGECENAPLKAIMKTYLLLALLRSVQQRTRKTKILTGRADCIRPNPLFL